MRTFIVLCLYPLAVTGSTALYAQSRLEKNVGDSELALHIPGASGSSSTFRTYSYGLNGGSFGPSGAPSTNILGGSYNSTTPFTFNYWNVEANRAPAAPTLPGMSSGSSGDFLYRGVPSKAEEMGGEGAVGTLLKRRASLWLTQDYSSTEHRLSGKKEDREPIKSLVPATGGMYRDFLKAGETAFQGRDYALAFSKFRMANYIGEKDPESFLSMSHAQFGGKCYSMAAYYLRQALRYMPRLPMVPLRPKAFYTDPSVYVQNVQDLDDYLDGHPQDTDALLLRAYYAWFDVDEADSAGKAQDLLQKALAGNNTPDMTLSIEAFWDGMVASGKVKGPLRPRPAPKTVEGGKKL